MSNIPLGILAGAGRGKTFRYFRIDITANNGDASFMQFSELEWMVGGTAHPIANMTSNFAPSPLATIASAEEAGSEAYKAFDGTSSHWRAASNTTGWLKLDLGAGNEIAPTSAKLTATSGDLTRAPKDFTFEGSNTENFSGEETVFSTETNETGWSSSEVREYTF